jgi:hypothetical protein
MWLSKRLKSVEGFDLVADLTRQDDIDEGFAFGVLVFQWQYL